jgi:hypothetical protein
MIRHDAIAPISSHSTFNAADGSAPCHVLLITNPAAPTTFIAWNTRDLPLSLSAESNA